MRVVFARTQIFERGRVWTVITSPLLETNFISLIFTGLMMWMLVPTLERFWGSARFYWFIAVTSIAGVLAGSALGLATGQVLNLGMSAAGLVLLIWAIVKGRRSMSRAMPATDASQPLRAPIGTGLWRPAVFAALLVVSLVIPSDWTQDIPERYGKRHPGLQHSALYPDFPAPP